MSRKNDPILSVQVPSEIRDTLDSCSQMEYMTRSAVIRRIFAEWYRKNKERFDDGLPIFQYSRNEILI